jgi:hypothetical protein
MYKIFPENFQFPRGYQWSELKFPPINLWNYTTLNRTAIVDEVARSKHSTLDTVSVECIIARLTKDR